MILAVASGVVEAVRKVVGVVSGVIGRAREVFAVAREVFLRDPGPLPVEGVEGRGRRDEHAFAALNDLAPPALAGPEGH